MKHALRQFEWLTPLFLIALLVGGGSPAEAQYQSGRLQGDYAFSTHFTCVDTTAGFTDDPLTLAPDFILVNPSPPSPGFTRRAASSSRGIISFNLDGTATQTFSSTFVSLSHASTPPSTIFRPVSESENECDHNYVVHPGGTATVQGSCTGTTVAGGGIGNTSITTGVAFNLLIVQGGNVLLTAPTHPPGIRTVTITTPSGGMTTFQRVCASSGVAHRIHR